MQAPNSSTIVLLILAPLIGWRVYSRVRRMVGRQRLSRVRLRITLTVFPILVLLLAYASRSHEESLNWLAAGLLAGALLAVYGLQMTRFEATAQGLFYTPNAHLGIALSILFVGRSLYRLVEVYVLAGTAPVGNADFVRSPLTLAVFGLLAGYYIGYAIGLARWRHRVLRAKRAREALVQ